MVQVRKTCSKFNTTPITIPPLLRRVQIFEQHVSSSYFTKNSGMVRRLGIVEVVIRVREFHGRNNATPTHTLLRIAGILGRAGVEKVLVRIRRSSGVNNTTFSCTPTTPFNTLPLIRLLLPRHAKK